MNSDSGEKPNKKDSIFMPCSCPVRLSVCLCVVLRNCVQFFLGFSLALRSHDQFQASPSLKKNKSMNSDSGEKPNKDVSIFSSSIILINDFFYKYLLDKIFNF